MLDFERYLGELRIQGALLRASAALAGTAAAVPSCPGWTVGDLVRHTAKVHQWATAILSGGESAAFQFSPPPDSRLFDAYDRGLAALLSRLRASAESPAAESGLPPVWTPVAAASATLFWARRQAHETAIHGVDAQLAAGYGVRDFAPEFAADGVAELLTDLAVRRFDTAAMPGRRTISLTPLDVNESWTLSAGPEGVSCRLAADDQPDLSVFGLADELYRWAWNRAGDDEVALRGDLSLADRWRHDFTVGSR